MSLTEEQNKKVQEARSKLENSWQAKVLIFFIVTPLLFAEFCITPFVYSKTWDILVQSCFYISSAFLVIKFVWSEIKNPRLFVGWRAFFGFLIGIPSILFLFFSFSIGYSFGGGYTMIFGNNYRNAIYYSDKNNFREGCFRYRASDNGQMTVVSNNLKRMAYTKDVCIPRVWLPKITENGFILVEGKESFFGKTITRVVIPKDYTVFERFKPLMNKFWETEEPKN